MKTILSAWQTEQKNLGLQADAGNFCLFLRKQGRSTEKAIDKKNCMDN